MAEAPGGTPRRTAPEGKVTRSWHTAAAAPRSDRRRDAVGDRDDRPARPSLGHCAADPLRRCGSALVARLGVARWCSDEWASSVVVVLRTTRYIRPGHRQCAVAQVVLEWLVGLGKPG